VPDVRLNPMKEAATRHLLALVLLTVLLWQTVVVPAPAAFVVRRGGGGGPRDAEEREGAGGERLPKDGGESDAARPASVDDLDWPEYING